MSARNLSKLIGVTRLLTVELSLTVPVRVLDAREHWGRVDALVEPLHGTGQRWVQADRLNGVSP